MKNETVVLGLLDYKKDHTKNISDDTIDTAIRAIQKLDAIERVLRSWYMSEVTERDFSMTYLCEIRDIVSNKILVGDSE